MRGIASQGEVVVITSHPGRKHPASHDAVALKNKIGRHTFSPWTVANRPTAKAPNRSVAKGFSPDFCSERGRLAVDENPISFASWRKEQRHSQQAS